MDDAAARGRQLAAVSRKWLEDSRADYAGNVDTSANRGHVLDSLVLAGARVSLSEHGRVVCSFRVPAPLTDANGVWHAGAIAAAVDNVCSAAATVVGALTSTVHYGMSYFSTAARSEVELDGRVLGRKEKLTAVLVQVRKMESGELVAIGKQWMTPSWPRKGINSTSKL